MHIGDLNDQINAVTDQDLILRHLEGAFNCVGRAMQAERLLTLTASLDGAICEAMKAQRLIDFGLGYLDDAILHLKSVREKCEGGGVYNLAFVAEAGGCLSAAKMDVSIHFRRTQR